MLDHEIIGKFKEFQEKTEKYSDLKIEDVRFEKVFLDNEKYLTINPSKTEIPNDYQINNIDVSFIPLSSINPDKGKIINYETRSLKDVIKNYTYFAENDIIFTKVTPSMENGNIAIAKNLTNGIGFGSSEYYIFRCKKIYNKLLYHLLRASFFRMRAKKTMKGSGGLKRVPISFFATQYIPIPKDLNEQYTSYKLQEIIVEFLEWGFAETDKIKENIDKRADILKRAKKCLIPSVFIKDYVKRTFGKYAKENGLGYNITDVEFEEKKIEKIANSISSSSGYNKNYYKNNQGKYPLYTGSLDVVAYVDPISEDDIINVESVSYNKDNDAGSKAFYHNKPYIMGGHHYAFVANNEYKDKISMKYFYFCLNDIFAKNRFYQSKQPVANIGLIKQYFIKIPKPLKNYTSLEIQKHIADFIDHYMNIIAKEEDRVNKAYDAVERLKKVYLNRTFRLINWEKNNE